MQPLRLSIFQARPDIREHFGQHRLDFLHRHAGLDARVVQDVQDVLVVDVEEPHRHIVVEHGPGHRTGVVDRPQRLQQFLIGAVEEDEIAVVDGEDHVGMLDLEFFVLAKARQALRIERGPDLAGPLAAVESRDGAIEIAVAHQLDRRRWRLRCCPAMAMSRCWIRAPISATTLASCALRSARLPSANTRTGIVVFPDAVDPAGEMIFGAERGLEKAIDDFAIGEGLLLGALTRGDGGILGRAGGGETTAPKAMPARTAASICNTCEDRRRALIASTLPQLPRARKA